MTGLRGLEEPRKIRQNEIIRSLETRQSTSDMGQWPVSVELCTCMEKIDKEKKRGRISKKAGDRGRGDWAESARRCPVANA